MWKPGDTLTHRFNPDLGPGRVLQVEGRTLVVEFPATGTTLRLATASDALAPLEVPPGATLDDLFSIGAGVSPIDRLAAGEIDPLEDFANRLDWLHLTTLREAEGLGSFLGGRIRLFPHQLYVAEQATRTDPVRWLLADEVGLGKTVEACLIANKLLRTGRAERTLVIAPETLTVQWLGELWRKYHQVFTLLDEQRLADVARDYGASFNPFDTHRRVVIGLDMLLARPRLTEQAVEAAIDLVIVDEAHHLQRPPGHPGNPAYRAVEPIAALGRHLLLLTATPLEDDAHGFFRLLQLLRPEEFGDEKRFEERVTGLTAPGDPAAQSPAPLPPCTSATRRVDVGGLPPRMPAPVEIDDPPGWAALAQLEAALRALPASNAAARRAKILRLSRALESGASIDPLLGPADAAIRDLARRAASVDPRTAWLVQKAREWKEAGDKTLVFVARRETLEHLRGSMEASARVRLGLFHEELSPARRDIEVAQFRLPTGPSIMISTECGGEGRNFEFCTRLVLFDLPWSPSAVEQRIGRLDRIGRTLPVEIVYFRPPGGIGAAIVRLYDEIGLFREPLGGLDRELGQVEEAIEAAALAPPVPAASFDIDVAFDRVIDEALDARARVRSAAFHELHRDPYRPERAESILARVPPDLDELNEEVVLAACERLGFHVEEHRRESTWAIEFGNRAIVDSLLGVRGGSSFLGTFDREEGVANESIDYFSSGHPLVEGILAELEDSPRGRVALLEIQGERAAEGLLAIYKEGPRFEPIAVDSEGREHPDLAELLTRRPLRTRRVDREALTGEPDWQRRIHGLASHLRRVGHAAAAAYFRIVPGGKTRG